MRSDHHQHNAAPASIGDVGVSLTFGLVIMAMIYAGGHLSGAHYNPSVTIAFTLARHFPICDALAYIAAQLIGEPRRPSCFLAAWTSKPAHLGATLPSVNGPTAAVYEIVLTAFLMFVITAVATDTRAVGAAAAIAIGEQCARCPVRRLDHRRLDEPRTLLRPRPGLRYRSSFWVYVIGPLDRRHDRRIRLPARALAPSPSLPLLPTNQPREWAADGERPVRLPA